MTLKNVTMLAFNKRFLDLFSMRGKLHWTAFIALLQNLPADSAFGRLIQIRTCEVPKPNKYNQKQIHDLMKAARIQINPGDTSSTRRFSQTPKIRR